MPKKILLDKKKIILERWVDLIIDCYPSEGGKFFRDTADPFRNPVGAAIQKETMILYEQLTGAMNEEIINKSLENLIKIRSIQDLTPSQAVSFVFFLKQAITEESALDGEESLEIHSRIDKLALMAFDIFMNCREKIFQIRVNEIKKRVIPARDRRPQ